MPNIELKEALDWIDTGKQFACSYVTADVTRGTGGEIKIHKRCIKSMSTVSPHTKKQTTKIAKEKKNPNHSYHATRNFFDLDTHKTFKVHIRLLLTLNNNNIL